MLQTVKMSICPTGPRISGGRERELDRGTGQPLHPLVGQARCAGTISGWKDAAPLARREASAPTAKSAASVTSRLDCLVRGRYRVENSVSEHDPPNTPFVIIRHY